MPPEQSSFPLSIDQIIDILNIIIPFASALILFYLASFKEKRISKTDVYKERLQNYYIPFYQMYCRGYLFDYPIQDMPLKSRGLFLDLFSQNIQYMDAKTQSLYPRYYRAFIALMEAEESGTSELKSCKSEFADIFCQITASTFSEYKHLLRKLKMPVPDI
ncbi:hypothetical protein AALA90_16160 [Lachnospiraceae bacterium 38-10]